MASLTAGTARGDGEVLGGADTPSSAIRLGTYRTDGGGDTAPHVFCEAVRLRPHVQRPWFRAYVAQRLGRGLGSGTTALPETAAVPDAALARHTLLCGATGSGKTRLLMHLLTEQLKAGCSAVVLDPKGELTDRLLDHAVSAGHPAETVTLLDPREGAGVPGWNPLATDVPLVQAVGDFVSLLERSASSWGPRLADLLTNALLVVGSHENLSLYEMARFLVREAYRERLLATPVQPPDPLAYAEARSYFRNEFGAWSRTEQRQASSPVLNKVREMLRSPFLRALLCARRNTLDLSRFWQRPGLLLVRLDRTSLGDEGTRLLAGLLTHALLRTALRHPGPVPVSLVIDELPVLEKFVGTSIAEIATVARSQNLRLLVACQHLAQISEGLRAALLANAAVQAFFRLGHADARIVAASLAAGTEPGITRLVATVDREDRVTGEPEMMEVACPIRDPYGRPLRVPPAVWHEVRWNDLFCPDPFAQLKRLAATAGLTRLYVRAPDTGEPVELRQYVRGLPPTSYRIEGPSLQLVVSFPRPKFTAVERESESDVARAWTGRLQELPVQHAVLRVANGGVGVIRVVDVPSPRSDPRQRERFAAASVAANGQTAAEIAATVAWREEAVETLAGEAETDALGTEARGGRRVRERVREPLSRARMRAVPARRDEMPTAETVFESERVTVVETPSLRLCPEVEDDGSIE